MSARWWAPAPPKRGRAGSFDVVLDDDGTLVATETLTPSTLSTEELVLTVPATLDRPTVRITGHPEQVAASRALRHRDRTLMEMIGPHPDHRVLGGAARHHADRPFPAVGVRRAAPAPLDAAQCSDEL